jgi:hypothetical protein
LNYKSQQDVYNNYNIFGQFDAAGLKPFIPLIYADLVCNYKYFSWLDYDCWLDLNFFSSIYEEFINIKKFSTWRFCVNGGPLTCHRVVSTSSNYYKEQIDLIRFYFESLYKNGLRTFDDGVRVFWLKEYMHKNGFESLCCNNYKIIEYLLYNHKSMNNIYIV